MFIYTTHKASTAKSELSFVLKAFPVTYFQMFLAPTLKGETSENQPPFRARGKADFHLSLTKDLPCGIPANALPGRRDVFNINLNFICYEKVK